MLEPALDTERIVADIRDRLVAALPQEPDPAQPAATPARNRTELRRFRRLLLDYPERAGKYIRGQVVYLSAATHGTADIDAVIVAAAAIELFQAWVLIHDDIEDDSETRRGLPALHRQVGMPIALNVGDALHVRMWRLLHELTKSGFAHATAVLDEFGTMIERTAEGQHLDLAYLQDARVDVSQAEYLDMVARKTASYTVVTPLRLGAMLAGYEPNSAFTHAGLELGVAFQIRDDVLNLQPSAGEQRGYGKEFAGDLYEGKRTLILAHMLAAAEADERRVAREILTRPRGERTAEDVRLLLASIARHGSLEYAQEIAAAKAEGGLALLSQALEGLPGGAAATSLLDLLASVALRDA